MIRALRHGVAGLDVVRAVEREWSGRAERWERQSGRVNDARDVEHAEGRASGHQPYSEQEDELPPPSSVIVAPKLEISPDNPYQPLTCRELPRRIFRSKSATFTTLSPLLEHLFAYDPPPNPNSHRGYPLSRAALASDYELVQFLLDRGADPSLKDGLAMQIAISKKDLRLVRMLYEKESSRPSSATPDDSMTSSPRGRGKKRSRPSSPMDTEGRPRKASKTRSRRMDMTPALMSKVMACGSREIIDYFVQENGVWHA
jgi:hypothetical protein